MGVTKRRSCGGKIYILLLPGTPKSGPGLVQREKDDQVRFSLQNMFELHKQWDQAGKQAGEIISVQSWLIP